MPINKYISAIGLELEGGWESRPQYKSRTIRIEPDGSVNTGMTYQGEAISPHQGFKSLRGLFIWMNAVYPEKINNTCGFHIHTSFKDNGIYSRLMHPMFEDYFINHWTKWGKIHMMKSYESHRQFWARLKGENTFCLKQFTPYQQIIYEGKQGNRYTQLNFTFKRFNTIECRTLPMFKEPEMAELAIINLVNIYSNFIDRYNKKMKAFNVASITSTIVSKVKDLVETISNEESTIQGGPLVCVLS